MRVLVAYATRYGATGGIAERIAERLRAGGFEAEVAPADAALSLDRYDAVVVGSAVYVGRWLIEARSLVRGNAEVLRAMPTWLFSSGPLGDRPTDARGRDLREVAEPEEYAEFGDLIAPKGTAVFFGALVPAELGFKDRSIRRTPIGRELLPEGDFRDWATIETWADTIVTELQSLAPA